MSTPSLMNSSKQEDIIVIPHSKDDDSDGFTLEDYAPYKPNCGELCSKYCFFLMFLPIWVTLSFLIEAVVVPFNIAVEFIKTGTVWYTVIIRIILSPLVLISSILMACLFSPVSISAKWYGFMIEEDFAQACRELLYPRLHPIFDEWLNQKVQVSPMLYNYKDMSSTQANSFGEPLIKDSEGCAHFSKEYYLSEHEQEL